MSGDEYAGEHMSTPGGSNTDPLALLSKVGGGRVDAPAVREGQTPAPATSRGGGPTRLQYGAPPPTDVELLLRKQAEQLDRMMQMVTLTQRQAADNARRIAQAASGRVSGPPPSAGPPAPPWTARPGHAGRWCTFDQYQATGRTVDQSLELDTDRTTGQTFVQEPAIAPPALPVTAPPRSFAPGSVGAQRPDYIQFRKTQDNLIAHCTAIGDLVGLQKALDMTFDAAVHRGIAAAGAAISAEHGAPAGLAEEAKVVEALGRRHLATMVDANGARLPDAASMDADNTNYFLTGKASGFVANRALKRHVMPVEHIFGPGDFGQVYSQTDARRAINDDLYRQRDRAVLSGELALSSSDAPKQTSAQFMAESMLRAAPELVVIRGLRGPTIQALQDTISIACLTSTSQAKADKGLRVVNRCALIASFCLAGNDAFSSAAAINQASIDRVEALHRTTIVHSFDPSRGRFPGPVTAGNHLSLLDWLAERRSEEMELSDVLFAAARVLWKSHAYSDGPVSDRRRSTSTVHGKPAADRVVRRFLWAHYYLRASSSLSPVAASVMRPDDPLLRRLFLASPVGPLAELCSLNPKKADTLIDKAMRRKTFARHLG